MLKRKDYLIGEIGYWIGKDYWNKGYCTEAANAIVEYGFKVVGLNKIYATHFKSNPASGEVMKNIGMKYEGCLRQKVKRWGEF